MTDVGIIGVGIHPFGRTEGRSGIDMGIYAVREALSDCNLNWEDVQFAYGGSDASGNADTMVKQLGLSGVQFVNVKNGCATGGSALYAVASTIKAGEYDIGLGVQPVA